MILYCVFCASPIPEERARKKAITCCREHARELNKARRRMLAERKCRLCGRGKRKTSTPATSPNLRVPELDHVRTPHRPEESTCDPDGTTPKNPNLMVAKAGGGQ